MLGSFLASQFNIVNVLLFVCVLVRACLWGRRMVHPRPSHGPGNAGSSSNQGLRLTEPITKDCLSLP
ncbi:hypothetical protein V1477_017038 [Vespula maculifrons]|uniref:Secreted protein n=1 Tax=Vespula maculifrons TaxID=7453 RepID=A0ABD2B4V9_VESMC